MCTGYTLKTVSEVSTVLDTEQLGESQRQPEQHMPLLGQAQGTTTEASTACAKKCQTAGWDMTTEPKLHEQCLAQCLQRFNAHPHQAAVRSTKRLASAAQKKLRAVQMAKQAAVETKQAAEQAARVKGVHRETIKRAQEAKAEMHAAAADQLVSTRCPGGLRLRRPMRTSSILIRRRVRRPKRSLNRVRRR